MDNVNAVAPSPLRLQAHAIAGCLRPWGLGSLPLRASCKSGEIRSFLCCESYLANPELPVRWG